MDKIIILAIQLVIAAGAFAVGKYVFPNIPKSVTEKLTELSGWASKFVVWAREFMKSSTGQEKMKKVVEKLKEIADEAGLNVTEEQLQAIAQTAYEAMIAGTKETATEVKEAVTIPAVNIYNTVPTVAELTDNVPPDALEENADGTVNVYDEHGTKTGTISKEEAERAAKAVTHIITPVNGEHTENDME